jgi:hypothetical protein
MENVRLAPNTSTAVTAAKGIWRRYLYPVFRVRDLQSRGLYALYYVQLPKRTPQSLPHTKSLAISLTHLQSLLLAEFGIYNSGTV